MSWVPSGFVHAIGRSDTAIGAVCPPNPSGFTQWIEPTTTVDSWFDLVFGGLVRTINNNAITIMVMLAYFMVCLPCSMFFCLVPHS
jgi:hypothetical protein